MRRSIESIAFGLVVVAVVPYMTLKVLWLSGSTIGTLDPVAAAEQQSERMVVGNAVTILMELLAIGLAVALIRPWGHRVPAWIVLFIAGGATGLLAPILLGLPLGSVIQLAVQGDLHTSGMENMAPWVFAVVYGGFALLAIGLAVLSWRYALARWGRILAMTPKPPATAARIACGIGMLPFAIAMLWWGSAGPGDFGPQAMDAPAQRTALVVTGVLSLAGWLAPMLSAAVRSPQVLWLVTWVGCATAALQGPTQLLLANDGVPTAAVALLTALATPASCVYGLLILRRGILDARHNEAANILVGTVVSPDATPSTRA